MKQDPWFARISAKDLAATPGVEIGTNRACPVTLRRLMKKGVAEVENVFLKSGANTAHSDRTDMVAQGYATNYVLLL